MVQKMPISNFMWSELTWSKELILQYNPDCDWGHFLEVDVYIPEHLHDKFNDYPLFPAPLTITEEMASPMSLEIRQKRNGQSGKKLKFSSTKLAPSLVPQDKYICHIRNLQFYLQQGAEITKIYRVLSFVQVIV